MDAVSVALHDIFRDGTTGKRAGHFTVRDWCLDGTSSIVPAISTLNLRRSSMPKVEVHIDGFYYQ